MVGKATNVFAADLLQNQLNRKVWNKIKCMWLLIYMGPQKYLIFDPGLVYMSKEIEKSFMAPVYDRKKCR